MSASDDRARLHVIIAGRVQGVFFRASAADQANAVGVTGWVRNRRDGSVELIAEGKRASLERLLSWCHRGPPGALVESVEARWQRCEQAFNDFRVRRTE